MYGNGGGSTASTAGGTATQPSAPKTNPVEVALQQESMGLQLKQIEAQNRLANAQATKTIAEANKIAGVDTKGQELQNKWQEIENRIQTSRESIEENNIKAAAANADKAIEDWKISVLEREYLDNVQEERVTLLVSEIAKSKGRITRRISYRRKLSYGKKDRKRSRKFLLRNDYKKNVRRGCKRISRKYAQKNRK